MPAHPLMNYDLWTSTLDQNALMASAAELHGLVAGMLSAASPADASQILPVLHDFLNDGQAVNAALKSQISELITETARNWPTKNWVSYVAGDDDALPERLEALVEWSQAFWLVCHSANRFIHCRRRSARCGWNS